MFALFHAPPGLADFVVGLVQGLGKLYQTPATAKLVESKADGADHDVSLRSAGPLPRHEAPRRQL